MQRLQKIIAQSGYTSRRKAEQLIREGRVKINGAVVSQIGVKADPKIQEISIDDKKLQPNKKIYILLNKPLGYVTTLKDPQGRPTVISLLTGVKQRVFPVGRLDINTSGALILTNDGDLANKIIHPRYNIKKTYLVRISGYPSKNNLKKLNDGIEIEGNLTAPARIQTIKLSRSSSLLKITIHEGRKRQIRRMFAAVNNPVLELTRIAYGNLKLNNLPIGKYQLLNNEEIARIFQGNSS